MIFYTSIFDISPIARRTILLAFVALILSGCGSPVLLYDLEGQKIDPLRNTKAAANVFLFTRTDCPISNRYAPVVRRLHEEFSPQGIEFWLVYPDPAQSPETIHQHLKEYSYPCRALQDPQHTLVERTQVTVTPEAAVLLPNGDVAYRGRIDNRYTDFGVSRPEATEHDLKNALTAILADQPIKNNLTTAVGCYISDLKSSPK